jgi:ornithine carbamoyltransferase
MNAYDSTLNAGGSRSTDLRHFLDLDRVDPSDLRNVISESRRRKAARRGFPSGAVDADSPLSGHCLAMIFEKPSTRTRVSFEMAMRQLGGDAIVLNGADLQLGRGETIGDTAQVLSSYVDAIMLRTFAPATLQELADFASIPVVNGLTDRSHPCQLLADLMTLEEERGTIEGATVAWTGDGNNIAATYIQAAAAFGFTLRVACPETLKPDNDILAAARAKGADITVTHDADAAVADADVVVTDTWLSMNDARDVRRARHNQLTPFQVDDRRMALASKEAIFLHCMPAHRDEEATASVMDGSQSRMFQGAENRLHVQKGVLLWCLGKI